MQYRYGNSVWEGPASTASAPRGSWTPWRRSTLASSPRGPPAPPTQVRPRLRAQLRHRGAHVHPADAFVCRVQACVCLLERILGRSFQGGVALTLFQLWAYLEANSITHLETHMSELAKEGAHTHTRVRGGRG